MIALITPTGARPRQIELCAKFMQAQNYKEEVLWVIIDDVDPTTTDFIKDNFKENWKIIKVQPLQKWKPGTNTQSRNMVLGMDIVNKYEVNSIFIIEDDDYYTPNYLTEMERQLQGCDIAGEVNTIYYNVHYHRWYPNSNMHHASLFQVAFNPKLASIFRQSCLDRNGKFIDMCFFRRAISMKCKINLFNTTRLSVGIKGLKGRAGIGFGHRMNVSRMKDDSNLRKLKELLGEDYKYYV